MKVPGFTAEAGLEPTVEQYGVGAVRAPDDTREVRPALVAPTVCRTSGCFTVGNCRTRVRCCRNFLGICSCSTLPCFILGQA